MVLTMWDRQVHVIHQEGFQLPAPSQCWDMTENTSAFFLLKTHSAWQGLSKTQGGSLNVSIYWLISTYCEPPPPFNNSCQRIRDYKADHLCQQGELLNALKISGSMVQGWASALVEFPTVVRKPAAGCSGRGEQGTGLVMLGLPHPVEGLVNLLITVFV